jgi:Flp pilus assembly protein TadG
MINVRIHEQHGTAMVEMALVLPILLFLALGIVDFGRAINYWNDTNQIAGDAARFAAVNKNPGDLDPADVVVETQFVDWIRGQAVTGELAEGTAAGGTASTCPEAGHPTCSSSVTSQLKVCVGSPTGQPLTVGNPIEVRVQSSYNLIPLIGESGENGFGSIAIKGQAVMRLERNYDLSTPNLADCPK